MVTRNPIIAVFPLFLLFQFTIFIIWDASAMPPTSRTKDEATSLGPDGTESMEIQFVELQDQPPSTQDDDADDSSGVMLVRVPLEQNSSSKNTHNVESSNNGKSEDENPTEPERCLANERSLSEDSLAKIGLERKRLLQAIKRVNKLQGTFCRPDPNEGQIAYRKCPIWRQEKLNYYYALMRVTYCTDVERWPNASLHSHDDENKNTSSSNEYSRVTSESDEA